MQLEFARGDFSGHQSTSGRGKKFFSWPGAAFLSSMAPLDVLTMAPLGVGGDLIARAGGC